MGSNGHKARRMIEIIEDDHGNVQIGPVTLKIKRKTLDWLLAGWKKEWPDKELDQVISVILDSTMQVISEVASSLPPDRLDAPPAGDPPLPS